MSATTETWRAALSRGRLMNWQRKLVRAMAEALYFDGEPPPADRLDWLVDDIDDYFGAISETTRMGLRAGMGMIELAPLLMKGKRLTSLPIAARIECLERIEGTQVVPVVMLFMIVKVMISAVYFEHPEALAETGFDGMAMIGERADRPLDPFSVKGGVR